MKIYSYTKSVPRFNLVENLEIKRQFTDLRIKGFMVEITLPIFVPIFLFLVYVFSLEI